MYHFGSAVTLCYVPFSQCHVKESDVELPTCSILFFVFYLKSFIHDCMDAELSAIYAMHYLCHGSPYEPCLAN